MEVLTCRLLPCTVADGPHNLAADEVLLRSAARGQASLRFYGWTGATLSLGYFQAHARRLEDPLLAGLPFVRRPTGGDALVHHHELTYCLALPAARPWHPGEPWLRMHAVIAAALADLGIEAHLHVPSGEECFSGFLCFQHFTAGDVLSGPAKVVGSAQRKQRGGVMQHGGILLAASPFTPQLPGLRERRGRGVDAGTLAAAIVRQLERATGWEVRAGEWTGAERRAVRELAAEKYASEAWNQKR